MRVVEGIWEDIEAQAQQLRGKRVRVIILDAEEMVPTRRDWDAFFADLLSRPAQAVDYDFEALRRESLYIGATRPC